MRRRVEVNGRGRRQTNFVFRADSGLEKKKESQFPV